MSAPCIDAGRARDGSDELKLASLVDEPRPGGESRGGIDENPSVVELFAMRVNGLGESGGAAHVNSGGKRREDEEAESGLDGVDNEKLGRGEMGGEIILTCVGRQPLLMDLSEWRDGE